MSANWRMRLAWLSAAVALVSVSRAGAETAAGCYAAIRSPLQGSPVGLTGVVEGNSATYGNVVVWVFTHRKGVAQWWPQNSGPVSASLFGWTGSVFYGAPREAGQPFEIAAIPVTQQTSLGLSGWYARTQDSGEYPGIPLPPPAPGCRYNVVDVLRSR